MFRISQTIKMTLDKYDKAKGAHKKLELFGSSDNPDIKALRNFHEELAGNDRLSQAQWLMLFKIFRERGGDKKPVSYKLLEELENALFGNRWNTQLIVNHNNRSDLAAAFVILAEKDGLTIADCAVLAADKFPLKALERLLNPPKLPPALSELSPKSEKKENSAKLSSRSTETEESSGTEESKGKSKEKASRKEEDSSSSTEFYSLEEKSEEKSESSKKKI